MWRRGRDFYKCGVFGAGMIWSSCLWDEKEVGGVEGR